MTAFHPQTPKKCPPKDAASPNGTFYRVIFNNPPTPDDFLVWILEPENKHKLEDRIKKRDCSAFALSMFTEEGTLRMGEMFWRGMNKKAQKRRSDFLGWAQVELDSKSGLLKQTGGNLNHFDLWPYTQCALENNVVSTKGFQNAT